MSNISEIDAEALADFLPETIEPTQAPKAVAVIDPRHEMILRAGSDPNFDIEKFERLVELDDRLKERQLEREAETAFNAAMAKVQAEIAPIATDADNKQTQSRYATFAALDRALRPIYSKAGFALSYNTEESKHEASILVVCFVTHTAPEAKRSHTRRYSIDMPADGKGAKGGDVMTRTHATGAAASYGQRYLLRMIFNLAVERDGDGNKADGKAPSVAPDKVKQLEGLIEETKTPLENVLAYFEVGALEELNAKQAAEAEGILKRAKAKAAAGSAK